VDLKRLAAAMGLRDSRRFEEAAKEFGLMAMETAEPEWKSNLLMTEHGCYCSLGRLDEAERVLEAMRGIKTDHVAIEMSREFSEACFFVQKGEAKRGLDTFESILARFGEPLGTIEFRYLYEDIQQRRGAVLANLGQYDQALVILREAESFRFDRIEDQQSVHLFIGICNRGRLDRSSSVDCLAHMHRGSRTEGFLGPRLVNPPGQA